MIDMSARTVAVLDPALFCFQIGSIRESKTNDKRSLSGNETSHSAVADAEHNPTDPNFVADGFARDQGADQQKEAKKHVVFFVAVRRDPKPRRVYELYAPNFAAMEDWVAILNAAHEIRLTSFD